jgi:hypothetical protein
MYYFVDGNSRNNIIAGATTREYLEYLFSRYPDGRIIAPGDPVAVAGAQTL